MEDTARDDLIWMAGFFDSEGSVAIGKHCQNGYTSHQLHVIVVNTKRETLEVFQHRFGGTIIKREPEYSHWAAHYDWRVVSKKAYACLKVLQPYIKLKAEHIRIALLFYEFFAEPTYKKVKGGGRAIDDNSFARRENFYLRMKQLNKKGATVSA